ncbi:Os01g0695650 [Oryza sativa Japonica Group]|uniref:Os01g0695650 protein n=1 Tax=Oryza sativa subsp. japonica TaxID=39947 RepID=A0A0P0V6Y5_ORYSJ|nr:Os01g0695650 [Oryza sativa Japonica Group]
MAGQDDSPSPFSRCNSPPPLLPKPLAHPSPWYSLLPYLEVDLPYKERAKPATSLIIDLKAFVSSLHAGGLAPQPSPTSTPRPRSPSSCLASAAPPCALASCLTTAPRQPPTTLPEYGHLK